MLAKNNAIKLMLYYILDEYWETYVEISKASRGICLLLLRVEYYTYVPVIVFLSTFLKVRAYHTI